LSAPFYLSCSSPADGLYQLEDGRFQLIANGPIAPLMTGFDYVLAEKALAEFLFARGMERVRFLPAIIYRRATGEEYRAHEQLIVDQRFSSGDIRDVALDGERLLLMDERHLFASPSLKDVLAESHFDYLQFSEGLSEFAAST
jgi:hypothetical protein